MRNDRERLLDAVDAAELITSAVALGRERFDHDVFVQGAVIRWLQVIGEALAHVSEDVRAAHPDVPWRAATAMRNRDPIASHVINAPTPRDPLSRPPE